MRNKLSKIVLTAANAKKFQKINTYYAQRSISPKRVQTLIRKMEAGLFLYARIAVVHRQDGDSSLMNGQHQCEAVIATGTRPKGILEEFWLENGSEAAVSAEGDAAMVGQGDGGGEGGVYRLGS